MDVAPAWYTVTGQSCSGETRRCGGGDAKCHAEAERDGYVAISLYTFCRREDVHTVPTANGVILFAIAAGALAAAYLVYRRRSRR